MIDILFIVVYFGPLSIDMQTRQESGSVDAL